ncbi:MAG: hypothetical protein WDZ43_00570 [Nitrosopumilaceae archaeon]
MTYQEREIFKDHLAKLVQVLDLDEGIRIETKSYMIFVNKSAKRYCINISRQGKEKFIYHNSSTEVLDFLKDKMDDACKIFSY